MSEALANYKQACASEHAARDLEQLAYRRMSESMKFGSVQGRHGEVELWRQAHRQWGNARHQSTMAMGALRDEQFQQLRNIAG